METLVLNTHTIRLKKMLFQELRKAVSFEEKDEIRTFLKKFLVNVLIRSDFKLFWAEFKKLKTEIIKNL